MRPIIFLIATSLVQILTDNKTHIHWYVGFVVVAFCIFSNHRRKSLLFLILLITFTFRLSNFYINLDEINTYEDKQEYATAVVLTEPIEYYYYTNQAEIKVYTSSGLSFNAMGYFSDDIKLGDVIEGNFTFTSFSSQINTYYMSKEVYFKVTADDGINIIGSKDNLIFKIKSFTVLLKNNIDEIYTDFSMMVKAICFGDKSDLSDEDYMLFSKAGISHVMAASGMHIAFLISFICWIFGKKYGSIISIFTCLIFTVMAGFTPSIIRASAMYIIFAISFLFKKQHDRLNSILLAAYLMMFVSPFVIYSISFQLSFLSTLGIILFNSKIYARLSKSWKYKLNNKVVGILAVSISALTLSMPVILYNYGCISVLAPIVNIFILPIISLVFILGFVSSLIYIIFPIVAKLAFIVIYAIKYIYLVCNLSILVPNTILSTENLLIYFYLFAFYLLVIMLIKNIKLYFTIPICAMIFATGLYYNQHDESIYIKFFQNSTQNSIMLYSKDSLILINPTASNINDINEQLLYIASDKVDYLIFEDYTGEDLDIDYVNLVSNLKKSDIEINNLDFNLSTMDSQMIWSTSDLLYLADLSYSSLIKYLSVNMPEEKYIVLPSSVLDSTMVSSIFEKLEDKTIIINDEDIEANIVGEYYLSSNDDVKFKLR